VIPTLPVGGSVTITLTANVVAASGSVTNTAMVAPPAGVSDPAPANNSASDTDSLVAAGAQAQQIPTLGGWMMILMGLLLLAMGGRYLRRR
ncbi:MAG: IPTL-CTERM sorting domain-containing protein, partial [Usitatibacter sp.]